jgi:hypothetical protein
MLLVETRRPPPPPPGEPARPAWEPNWRLWGWALLGVGGFVAADRLGGIAAYLVLMGALACVCRAVCVVLPPLDGLREHRQ